MAGLGGWIGGLNNNTIVQMAMMQIVGQLVAAVITPYTTEITNEVNHATPLAPLTPELLAAAVERGEISEAQGADQAAYSGIDAQRFHLMTRIAGESLGPMELAVARRRGIIDEARYRRGIAQGSVRTEWADVIESLAVQQPSPGAILGAYLEGQIPEAEARRRYKELGGAPEYFDILFDSQGSSPTPLEAIEMANRGIIPWDGTGSGKVSYQQAFLEGPWRNKWAEPFRTLGEYLPPPRTVTAMMKEGSLTRAEGAALLAKQGLAPKMVEAYLRDASSQKTAATKDLAQSTITTLYADRLLTAKVAGDMLETLGYDADEAGFLLAIQDVKLAQRYLTAAVGRIHTLYVGHKLDKQSATDTLAHLGLEPQAISDVVAIWDWERAANVKLLTPAQIGAAYKIQIMDQATAIRELVEQGYTPYDAWVLLSIVMKTKLGGEPPVNASGIVPGPQ